MTVPHELIPPDLAKRIEALSVQGHELHGEVTEWAAAVSDATGAFEDAIRWLGLDDGQFEQAEKDVGLRALNRMLDRFAEIGD